MGLHSPKSYVDVPCWTSQNCNFFCVYTYLFHIYHSSICQITQNFAQIRCFLWWYVKIDNLGPVAKFQWSVWLDVPQAGPALWNYPAPPYSRLINTIRQKGSAWRVLPMSYAWNILYSKILPAKSRARRRPLAAQAAPNQAVHRNLAMVPYVNWAPLFVIKTHPSLYKNLWKSTLKRLAHTYSSCQCESPPRSEHTAQSLMKT